MDIARLFIGLPLPDEYQEGLGRLLGSLKPAVQGSCTWARPGSWHLTLKFLGDVPAERLPELESALGSVAWKAFSFRPGGGGYFPSMERPRVMWVGALDGGRECRELASAIEEALIPLGFEPEMRPFSAHLTVARIKSARHGADWGRPLGILLKAQWPQSVVDRFVLWRSYLDGGKSIGEAGGAGAGGPPGPLHVPLGEFGASG